MHLRWLTPLLLLALSWRPAVSHAESAPAYTDISLSLESTTTAVDADAPVQVTLTLQNDGNFGTGSARVSIPIPTGLTLSSALPDGGSYDSESEVWTSAAISSYELSTLVFDFVVNSEGPSEIKVIAELIAFDSEYGSYDPDSTPDNGDECEDDYASLTLQVNGRPIMDAGVPEPDCDPEGPGPGPGPGPGDPVDAGAQAGPDAGLGEGNGDSGCSSSGSRGSSILMFLVLGLLLRRRMSLENADEASY